MQRLLIPMLIGMVVTGSANAQMAQADARTDAEKVANAATAAPAAIAANATIKDWPAAGNSDFRTLRQGTNGWVCLPAFAGTDGNDPMCLDETWVSFIQAYVTRQPLRVERVGVGYMVAPGGASGSNTDPYASGPTADNEWALHGPHIMLAVPDARALQGLPTKHDNGGPWVMWAGTPYAHIMIPLGSH
jgi:hypothetical protein